MGHWHAQLNWTSIPCAVLAYASLVSLLRWRRYNQVHGKYGHKIDNLTPQDAQEVMHLSNLWDMPGLYNYAVSFALFKTYAIPSISKLLAATKELGSAETISRRYADTEILISAFMRCPIFGIQEGVTSPEKTERDPRAAIAVARMNWLHSKYEISNDDYLYTLSLFILEPIVWIAQYGWRPLSSLECQAHYVFWRHIGTNMGIKHIPETLQDFKEWSKSYEEKHMVPATSNRDVAMFTTNELLHVVPEAFGLKSAFRGLTVCLLEDRVRIAMMQPKQGWFSHALVKSVLYASKYLHRYLSLPRPHALNFIDVKYYSTKSGVARMFPSRWQAKPWYKPMSYPLIDRLTVFLGLYDNMPGPKYKSEGFRLEELGPLSMENFGGEEVMEKAAEMMGCPITGIWSLDDSK